jgi:hypothetical protein
LINPEPDLIPESIAGGVKCSIKVKKQG